jgi:hypothetical protein
MPINIEPKLLDAKGLINALWPDPTIAPCERTIIKLRRSGKIPSVRLGRFFYFDAEQVRQHLLNERQVKA